jgi:hypothetical protein
MQARRLDPPPLQTMVADDPLGESGDAAGRLSIREQGKEQPIRPFGPGRLVPEKREFPLHR